MRLLAGSSNANLALGEHTGVEVPTRRQSIPAARPVAPALDPLLEQAASALYREHHAFVWRNARRLGCDDDWVDDAVHEVFLIATRRLNDFEGRSSARTWLFGITFRVVQRMRRDRARQRRHVQLYAEQQQQPGADLTSQPVEAAQYLRHLLSLLPAAQQLVLILAELEGFTSLEIAETLAIPVGTVHSRLRAAKKQLARAIEQDAKRSEGSVP